MTAIPTLGPGTVLIFVIIMAPVYLMLGAWYVGDPIDRPRWLLGVGYVVGITTVLWGGMFVLTVLIGVIFF